MAGLKFLIVVITIAFAQVSARTFNLHDDFGNAIRDLQAAIQQATTSSLDHLEPMYQDILLASKGDIYKALYELDAYERSSIRQVNEIAANAPAGKESCYQWKPIEIEDRVLLANKLTTSCVDSTMNVLETIFSSGISQILNLNLLVTENEQKFYDCNNDECKIDIIGHVNTAAGKVEEIAKDITEHTAERMDNVIPGYEDRCIASERSHLVIEVEEIIDEIKQCIAS